MRCALLQCNTKVGDITGNTAIIIDNALKASSKGAQLCITPELALTGYPPKDLLEYPAFIDAAELAAEKIARALTGSGTALILGSIGRNAGHAGKRLFNQALFCESGVIRSRYSKRLLPFYDAFDEGRYFELGTEPCVITFNGFHIALTICEDVWNDDDFFPIQNYTVNPLSSSPAFDIIINLSASPFAIGKQEMREKILASVAVKHKVPVLYTNLVGGNDNLIFDGRSMAFSSEGSLFAKGEAFREDIILCDVESLGGDIAKGDIFKESETWRALTLG